MQESFDQTSTLFFMHIPKSGGTAVRDFLSATFLNQSTAIRNDGILHSSDDIRLGLSRPGLFTNPSDIPDSKVLMGHMSLTSALIRHPSAELMTLVRLPILRLISHYIYARSFPIELIHDKFDRHFILRSYAQLEEFLCDPSIAMQTDNLLTRFLTWPNGLHQERFISLEDDEKLVKKARESLDGFSFVEIYEDPVLWDRLRAWLGSQVAPARANETSKPPIERRLRLDTVLTARAFELLYERTRLDDILWRHVAQRHFESNAAEALRAQATAKSFSRFGRICAP